MNLVEELGADTYVYGSYAAPDGTAVDIVARGHVSPSIGATIKVAPTRTYVFDSEGDRPRLS